MAYRNYLVKLKGTVLIEVTLTDPQPYINPHAVLVNPFELIGTMNAVFHVFCCSKLAGSQPNIQRTRSR
jgi:hypothetical protein